MTAPWEVVLDDLERQLDLVEASLADGCDVVVDDLHVPEQLGPLPGTLRTRALVLQGRMAAVELAVTLAAQRARQAMVLAGATADAGPSLFDARH